MCYTHTHICNICISPTLKRGKSCHLTASLEGRTLKRRDKLGESAGRGTGE